MSKYSITINFFCISTNQIAINRATATTPAPQASPGEDEGDEGQKFHLRTDLESVTETSRDCTNMEQRKEVEGST